MGRLAAGVAHELGTPLNVIDGRARQIERRELPRERQVETARIISRQVARMATIIRGLLDFCRLNDARRAPLDLCALVRETVELLERHAGRAGVTWRVDVREEPVRVEGNATQLEQVLTNLIVNGVQAMPEGGRLGVRVGLGQARCPANGAEATWAVVSVSDSGTGIREEDRPRLFEPFFTTKAVGQGTGLGLSVVHGIVTEHGGWIEVESAPGKGSTFTVHLPLAPEAAPAAVTTGVTFT